MAWLTRSTTKNLEDAFAKKQNVALLLTGKIAALDARIETATHGARPALREELLDLRADLAKAEAAVTEAEAPLAHSRFLDVRAARRADFEAVNARAVKKSDTARAALVVAAREVSEACVLGRAASAIAVELGGANAGYTADPRAFGRIYMSVFEKLSHGSDVVQMDEVRWPTVKVALDLPAPGKRTWSLVSSEETEAHLAADAELAAR